MADDAEEEVEDVQDSVTSSFSLSSTQKLGAGVVVAVAAAVVLAFTTGMIPMDDSTEPVDNPDNSSDSDSPEQVGLAPSDIPGEIVDVNISGVSAEPFRPEISPDDGIRFHNNKDINVKFVFDRGVPNFTMASGETTIVDVNNIVYYDILPNEEGVQTAAEGGSFRVIEGGVNVQS
jgi:hypothetical protein